jgi:hypothetical protein
LSGIESIVWNRLVLMLNKPTSEANLLNKSLCPIGA